MSRNRREIRIETEERWPTLFRFLAGYCHEDFSIFHGTPEGAIDAAIAEHPLADRQQVLREWREWNGIKGCANDPRSSVNDGLGVAVHFETPADARQFMNLIYDKVMVSVRNETSTEWKP